jgi:glycosyltransferase involved in cell wall biosynthesis
MWQFADALTAKSVKRFHAVGNDVADVMARRLAIRRTRIDVVPRGRDPVALGMPSMPRASSARERLGLEDCKVVLAVGRQEHEKGFDTLLEAADILWRVHPSLRVLIAGREGAATPGLERQAKEFGLTAVVSLLGHRSDVPELLSACNAFVLPSRREGSPGSLIEAMALEVPSVATDIPAVREVVGSPPVALLTPADEPTLLAAAIGRVLSDEELGADLGSRARKRFLDCYTVDSAAAGMRAIYERALDPRADRDRRVRQ